MREGHEYDEWSDEVFMRRAYVFGRAMGILSYKMAEPCPVDAEDLEFAKYIAMDEQEALMNMLGVESYEEKQQILRDLLGNQHERDLHKAEQWIRYNDIKEKLAGGAV